MIPNKSLDRLFEVKQPTPQPEQQSAVVPYEEVDVVVWTFELPHGPQEFMVEAAKGDFVKEEKDRFTYRCRIGEGKIMEGSIYKRALYMERHVATRARVRITAEPVQPFVPTKLKTKGQK